MFNANSCVTFYCLLNHSPLHENSHFQLANNTQTIRERYDSPLKSRLNDRTPFQQGDPL